MPKQKLEDLRKEIERLNTALALVQDVNIQVQNENKSLKERIRKTAEFKKTIINALLDMNDEFIN